MFSCLYNFHVPPPQKKYPTLGLSKVRLGKTLPGEVLGLQFDIYFFV